MEYKQNSKKFILIFLGTLSAFGPFIMDMYLPTLPAMSDFFNTTSSQVQLGLTSCMIGLAIGQLLFGPLSDRYGRRSSLLVAMLLFLLSTLGCLLSQSIGSFIAFRFVQGIAASGGVVLSRSIAADKYSSHELAAMLAVIGSINGVATVAAPVIGGVLAETTGWHGIFWLLFALGILLLAGSIHLDESLPTERRQNVKWHDTWHSFGEVFHNRPYLTYILQYGFSMSVLFTNIASAPFIMQQHYGLSPVQFSLFFGINAIAMAIASAASVKFSTMETSLHFGSNGMLAISVLLCCALYLQCNFWIYETLIFCLLLMVGVVFTASNALAMDSERKNAGIASALLGAMGFAFGGIITPLVGLGDIMLSTSTLFLSGSVCTCLCGRFSVHRLGTLVRVYVKRQ